MLRLNISGNPGRICSERPRACRDVLWDFPDSSAPGFSVLGRNLAFSLGEGGSYSRIPCSGSLWQQKGQRDVLEHPKLSERHHCPLASTAWPQLGAVTQIPLNVIARRALILPRVQGANSLPRAAPGGSDLPRDGCRVGLWLCHWFGTNPWELEVSTSPWPCDLGVPVVLDCTKGSMENISLCLLSLLEIKQGGD